jgi:hypothetical protein
MSMEQFARDEAIDCLLQHKGTGFAQQKLYRPVVVLDA